MQVINAPDQRVNSGRRRPQEVRQRTSAHVIRLNESDARAAQPDEHPACGLRQGDALIDEQLAIEQIGEEHERAGNVGDHRNGTGTGTQLPDGGWYDYGNGADTAERTRGVITRYGYSASIAEILDGTWTFPELEPVD